MVEVVYVWSPSNSEIHSFIRFCMAEDVKMNKIWPLISRSSQPRWETVIWKNKSMCHEVWKMCVRCRGNREYFKGDCGGGRSQKRPLKGNLKLEQLFTGQMWVKEMAFSVE